MTLWQQLSRAYPLHAQRIMECAAIQWGNNFYLWRQSHAAKTPGDALAEAFVWGETDEGCEYWSRLAGWWSEE